MLAALFSDCALEKINQNKGRYYNNFISRKAFGNVQCQVKYGKYPKSPNPKGEKCVFI